MTVIVYDGTCKTLSADTLVSSTGQTAVHRIDALFKITDLSDRNLKYGNEKLLAYAGCGALSAVSRMFDVVVRNFNEWDKFFEFLRKNGVDASSVAGNSAMLVTTKRVLVFHFMAQSVRVVEHALHSFIAVGSGQDAAMAAMRVFGLTGHDAVIVAGMTIQSCGLVVNTYDIAKGKLKARHPVIVNHTVENVKALRQVASKSKLWHGDEPTPAVTSTFKFDVKEIQDKLGDSYRRNEIPKKPKKEPQAVTPVANPEASKDSSEKRKEAVKKTPAKKKPAKATKAVK